jgi:hypothetical protein
MIIGNKFNGDNIAQEFAKHMSSRQQAASLRKEAALAAESQIKLAQEELKPEDFLVAPESKDTKINSIIDNKISELSEPCEVCKQEECTCGEEEACETCKSCDKCGSQEHSANDCMMGMSNDVQDLVDVKAQYVIKELGKMASGFRAKDQFFAADMVEATAISIRNDLIKEASQKLETILELKKLAQQSKKDGDLFSTDLIEATIRKIKINKNS